MIPSCQTLSKAFDLSKDTPLTSTVGISSREAWISWVDDNNSAIHESPGRKPDLKMWRVYYLKTVEKGIINNYFEHFYKNRK